MQVLLTKSDERHDVTCSVCGQGFRLYWERTSIEEQAIVRIAVLDELRRHHASDATAAAHPEVAFNFPSWTGAPEFSGAALLGGLSGLQRARPDPDRKRSN
jgi:hypothetical protein